MNEVVTAYITDDNYVMPTIVSITSAVMNKNENSIYKIYIIGVAINDENKKIFDEFISKNIKSKIHIEILHFKQHYNFDNSHLYVTSAAIFKFDIANILQDYDKVLYLDCDTIILKDLTELFNIDILNYYAAIVKDYYVMIRDKHNKKIGIENYFNSGVMLLNTKILRLENIRDKLIDYKINGYNRFMDQDAFNFIFNNKVKFIHTKYNYIMDWFGNVNVDRKVLLEFYNDDINEPAVIMHLAGPKPWNNDTSYNYFYDFWNYYQYTDYFKNNPLWLINKISEQKTKSLENKINEINQKINILEKKYSENWIKLFGIYNNRDYIFIYIFFIKFTIKMNEKNIKNISWWIPVKKWRDNFRKKFRRLNE